MERFEELNSREFQQRNETSEIYIPPGPRLGNKVVEVEGISKSFGDKLLYKDLSFTVPPTAIVGIVGPNGAGKTTLFRMMTGEQQPDTGTVTLGDSVKLLMWVRFVTPWMTIKPFGKKCLAVLIS